MDENASGPARRGRADAARNRDRLLRAAKEILSKDGPRASLESVARAAEVGVGTLYRHFPTRADLFEAVYRREVDQLAELSVTLSRELAPVAALRRWLRANVEFVATKKGLLAALSEAAFGVKGLKAYTSVRLTDAVTMLMDRAIAAGELREDVGPDEMLRMLVAVCYGFDTQEWQGKAVRLLDVFVDGLERKRSLP